MGAQNLAAQNLKDSDRSDRERHRRSQLEELTKDQLIDLVISIERKRRAPQDLCDETGYQVSSSIDLSDPKTEILSAIKNRGYTDDGSLNWPNAKVLYKRNKGYTDDKSIFYQKIM
jgi:hypothetical protein